MEAEKISHSPAMTSEILKNCEDYSEFRKVLFSRNEPVRHLHCGSFFEMPILYCLSNPTDIDVMFCDMTFCAIYSYVTVPATRKRNVLTIDTTDCHVGFVRLRKNIEYFRKPYDFDTGPACKEQVSIQDNCVRSLLGQINTRWLGINLLSRDKVYAIPCPLWPPEALEWIIRKRVNDWPSDEVINAIVKSGCHLVSKPHGKNPNDDTQWRYSFSQAETILIHNSWTDVQKYIYHLLRIIKRDVVNKCGGENKTFISSYYFKTLMLWACEEKPSEFWEDKNIATSVRELLLGLIEKLIERNVPHYFMPANNIMDDLPINADVDHEIHLLLSYREEDIFETVRKEPKAYHIDPGLLIISNESLYPHATKISNTSTIMITDRYLQELGMHCSCYNYIYPELEYLHKAILIHLKLSELNKYENQKPRQDLITSAEELFDLSIQKVEYGFTRIRCQPGWSVFELYQQLWLLCKDKHPQDQNTMLNAESFAPRTTSTSCYIRDRNVYVSNQCKFLPKIAETRIFPILQKLLLIEMPLPINATYFVCSAYRANFFFNGVCNYRRALDLCKEVKHIQNCSSAVEAHLLPFPLRNEWSGLYDEYIQIIFGFLTLHRTLIASPTARKRMITVYISSPVYLNYIHTRCCRILNEPVNDFGWYYNCRYKFDILRFRVRFSKAILRTALNISKPNLAQICRRGIKL